MNPESLASRVVEYVTRNPPGQNEVGYFEKVAKALKTTPGYVKNICCRRKTISPRLQKRGANKPKEIDESLFGLIRKSHNKWTVGRLANHLDVSPKKIEEAIVRLKEKGRNIFVGESVEVSKDIPTSQPTKINIKDFKGKEIRFGLTSDNHLGSKYCRLDVLEALYDIWEKQGIKTVYQCGNMIDGEARFNKFDLMVHGMNNQVDYFVEHWPKRKGITTYFVTGDDHEGWYVQREGVDIGKVMQLAAKEAGREDLVFLGHMEHDVCFVAPEGKAYMRLIHAGGGSAYATSYAPQKIVESYQGGEKPNILLIGHYHKADYGYPREVHVVQAACTEDQTPFMRKQKIPAHIGGWTISFTLSRKGMVHGFTPQFHPFYNRGFYGSDNWKYHWKKQ